MAETDITFLLFMGIGCIVFTLFVFIWRGITWMGILSGVFWILFGMYFNSRTQEGARIMQYQEYMPAILIGVGIAMILSPFWLKSKDIDIMDNVGGHKDMWSDNWDNGDDAFNAHISSKRDR